MALMELAAGASPAEQLNHIRAVAMRGAGIIQQLMIYAGRETAVSEPVDISWLIGDMIELLKVVISKHAVLKTELVSGLPAVLANPAQLRQVVMNLVINASQAIGEQDGVIAIRTAPVKSGQEPPRARADTVTCNWRSRIRAAVSAQKRKPRFLIRSSPPSLRVMGSGWLS
jgi:C4-dicarboxylate-specific signal transduction histidine kinase